MERRLEERRQTDVRLSCRIPASPLTAIMHDLSHHGCQIEVRSTNIELGGTALIDLPGAPRFRGRVMWKNGRLAGIRFERRLAGAVAVGMGLEIAEQPSVWAEPVEGGDHVGLPRLLRHWIRRLTSRIS